MVDRTIPPPIHEIINLRLPEFHKVDLSNNISMGMVRQNGHPVIIFNLIIPSGALQESLAGITYFTSKMLSQGTSMLNSYQIASKIDFYGGQLEITPSPDHVSIKLYTIRKFFPELLLLLANLLADARYPEKEFDTMKQIRKQQIRQQFAKNNLVAGQQFRKVLFGESHPYGQIVDESTVERINLDKVVEYYKNGFLRKPKVYLAGDFDDSEMRMIDKTLSEIRFLSTGKSEVPVPRSADNMHIERPESLQTSIRLGSQIISRHHKDHLHLRIANELLGGFFGSRLMKNIREEKGLTYGIYSSFIHFQALSFWQIGTDVLKEKKEEAIQEIINEVKTLQDSPPAPDELQTMKNYLKGKITSSFDNVIDSLEIARMLDLSGLDLTYWEELFKQIDRISAEEISSIARKHFDLKEIRIVTVG